MTCVLDDWHWETAVRYVELNPARARPVPDWPKTAEDYRWSTARAHLGLETPPQLARHGPIPAPLAHARQLARQLGHSDAARSRRRPPRHPARLGPGLQRIPPKPRAHLQNPPTRPARRPPAQGPVNRSADAGSSKPIGKRLNAEDRFCGQRLKGANGVPIELQNPI